MIGDQNIIPLNGFNLNYTQPVELTSETQLIEVIDPNGLTDGYLVAVSVEEATNPGVTDVALIRLDKEGCPQWSRILFTGSSFDVPIGLFQGDMDEFIVFTATETTLTGAAPIPTMRVTIVDPLGAFCNAFEYVTSEYFYPVAVKEVEGNMAAIGGRYVVLANTLLPLSSPEQIAVGFINGSDFSLFNNAWQLYDFDFAGLPSSSEIGVDIEQYNDDLIITGRMNRVGDDENFLMSITPFDSSTFFIGQFNYAFGYNEPGGNDLPTDLEVDEANGRFTVSYITFDFLLGLPVTRTFQTDDAGTLLWNRGFITPNEIAGFNYTMYQTSDGGYFQAGFLRGGPAIQDFPMWMAKTDGDLQLSNCDCYTDVDLTVDFREAEREILDGGYGQVPCEIIVLDDVCESIQQEAVFCDPEDIGPCEDLDVFVTAIDTSNHQCCWALSYNNGGQDNPYYITITSLDSAQLVYDPDTDIPPPLRRFSFNDTMVVIGMEMPGGPLPTGNFDDFFTFCLSNIQNSPQQVLIEWRDSAYNVICDETLEFDCEPELEECLYILTDTLICDSAGYKYIATVKNPINSEFPVGLIKLNVLNPSTGIMVQDSIIELDPALAIGDTMMIMFVIETEENLFGEEFCFLLSAHDSPDELLCCAEIEKCIPFPLCDPCDEVDVMAMPIDPINEDSCCYTFTVKNGYDVPGYFTNIEMNILTEGVYFSVTEVPTPPVWWYEEIETGTHYLWSHFSGSIPIDTVDVFDFCIDGVTTTDSVYIEVNWLQEDSILCYDTLALYCPQCVEITQDTVECLPDGTHKYTFNFTNLNDLGLPINAIRFVDDLGYIVDPAAGDYLLLPTPVPYGQTSTSNPMVVIDAPDGVDTFCFKMVMTYLNEDSVNVECCYVDVCIDLPPCEVDPSDPACLELTVVLDLNGGVQVDWTVNDGDLFTDFDVLRTDQTGGPNVIHVEPSAPGVDSYSYLDLGAQLGLNVYQVIGNTPDGVAVPCDSVGIVIDILEPEFTTMSVYPNPATDILEVWTNVPGNYQVEVLNIDGRQEYSAAREVRAEGHLSVEISNLASGVFIIRLRDENGNQRQARFVKSKY